MTYPWNNAVRDSLLQRKAQGRFPHATLLSGPAGIGKRSLAMELAAALLCLEGSGPACGTCRSCQLLASGAHPDFRELTFERNEKDVLRTVIRVAQVRDLIASLQLTHGLSACKVAVIHPAEAMNPAAANALLKTLEEPPGSSYLLLVANHSGRLPATIRSRCQRVGLTSPAAGLAAEWLVRDMQVDPAAAALALRAAAGSPLRARAVLAAGQAEQFGEVDHLLDQVAADPGTIGAAADALGALDPAWVWSWLSLLAATRLKQSFGLPAGAGEVLPPQGMMSAARGTDRRRLSELQLAADRNRRLLDAPLRKDLLLRDWLIQWARVSEP